MGNCGSKTKDKSATDDRQATTADREALPRRTDPYLGQCWLLADTSASFSPSRWFCLCPRTLQGQRAGGRRCFSHSTRLVPRRERARVPFLAQRTDLDLCEGLSLTCYDGVTVHAYAASTCARSAAVNVGGVHVDVSGVADTLLARAADMPLVFVVALRRAEVEMEPSKYRTAPYTRYAVQAPPANEEQRQAYGEGCITGIQYGAYAMVQSGADVLGALRRACEASLSGASVKCTARREVPASDAAVVDDTSFRVRVVEIRCEGGGEGTDSQMSLSEMGAWVAAVYTNPRRWCATGLFLQRYEAIGQSLLHAA